jgi:hypothetical protein
VGPTPASRSSSWLAELATRARLRAVSAALSLALGLLAPPARGTPVGALVVVVSSNPNAPFVRRLAAELSLFGYRVEVTARDAEDVDLAELLARHGGAALIAVDQPRQTAEVIVGQPTGLGPFRHERERLDPRRQADTNAAVLAERFRARLTELGISPAEDAQPLAPAELPPAPPRASERLWVSGALGASSGGLGAMVDLELELRAFALPWLSTSAFVRLSPFPARVTAPEGTADVTLLAGGASIDVYPLRRQGSDWSLKLGAGAMLIEASMKGHATPPFRDQTDAVLVPATVFDSAAIWRLSSRTSLELRGFVGVCTERVAVRFAGRAAAEFGQPFVGVSLGAAVGLF